MSKDNDSAFKEGTYPVGEDVVVLLPSHVVHVGLQ